MTTDKQATSFGPVRCFDQQRKFPGAHTLNDAKKCAASLDVWHLWTFQGFVVKRGSLALLPQSCDTVDWNNRCDVGWQGRGHVRQGLSEHCNSNLSMTPVHTQSWPTWPILGHAPVKTRLKIKGHVNRPVVQMKLHFFVLLVLLMFVVVGISGAKCHAHWQYCWQHLG